MNMLEAVANRYGCQYGTVKCKDDCENYMMVDPRGKEGKDKGPRPKGIRTLCNLFEDFDDQLIKKTNDPRLNE